MNGWKRSVLTAAGLMGLGLCAMGSGKGSTQSSGAAASATTAAIAPVPSASAAAVASAVAAAKSGTLSFKVTPTKNGQLALLQTMMDSKEYPGGVVTKALNDALVFPNDIHELVRDCGAVNAFYEADNHTVNLCYELAAFFFGVFTKANIPGKSPVQRTIDAMVFTQLHETGHAIIKELNIGAMGNEETDVDGFATVFLLEAKAGGVARDGALAMLSLLGLTGTKPQYLDEHPPSQARFSDILCLIYGSDPTGNADLIANHYVLAERAPKCAAEFTNTLKVWDSLLEPHQKKNAKKP